MERPLCCLAPAILLWCIWEDRALDSSSFKWANCSHWPWNKQWLYRGSVGCLIGVFLVLVSWDLSAQFVRNNEDFTSAYLCLVSTDSASRLSSTGVVVWTFTCAFWHLSGEMERLGTRSRGIQGVPLLQAIFLGPAGSLCAGAWRKPLPFISEVMWLMNETYKDLCFLGVLRDMCKSSRALKICSCVGLTWLVSHSYILQSGLSLLPLRLPQHALSSNFPLQETSAGRQGWAWVTAGHWPTELPSYSNLKHVRVIFVSSLPAPSMRNVNKDWSCLSEQRGTREESLRQALKEEE